MLDQSEISKNAHTATPLALHGGRPVREKWLPYGHQSIDQEDIDAVIAVLRSDWLTQGPDVEAFERALADYCGASYGVAFSSGTAALHAACRVAGLGPGDEAITTPLTFVATANAAVYCGAKPVFADIRADTLNVDPLEIERRITTRTKAIIPVDFAGHPVDLEPILVLAKKHNLLVIEDACHALGAEYKGRKIGGISDMTVFSFHPVKHITTGEGGMVLTDDKSLAEDLRTLRHHGVAHTDSRRPWLYEVPTLGFNYRLSDIHCALGLSQLRKLSHWTTTRQEIATRYRKAFSHFHGVSMPSVSAEEKHAWHLFILLLDLSRLSVGREIVVEALRAENIGATVHYPLVHLQPFYRKTFGCVEGNCPVAEATAPRMITLPLFQSMTDDDIADVIQAVNKVVMFYATSRDSLRTRLGGSQIV